MSDKRTILLIEDEHAISNFICRERGRSFPRSGHNTSLSVCPR